MQRDKRLGRDEWSTRRERMAGSDGQFRHTGQDLDLYLLHETMETGSKDLSGALHRAIRLHSTSEAASDSEACLQIVADPLLGPSDKGLV